MNFKLFKRRLNKSLKFKQFKKVIFSLAVCSTAVFFLIPSSAVEYTGPYAFTNAQVENILSDSNFRFSLTKVSGSGVLVLSPYFSDSSLATSDNVIDFDIINRDDYTLYKSTFFINPIRGFSTNNNSATIRVYIQLSFPFPYRIKNDSSFSALITFPYLSTFPGNGSVSVSFLNEDDSQFYNLTSSFKSTTNYTFRTYSDLNNYPNLSTTLYNYNPKTNAVQSTDLISYYNVSGRFYNFDFPDDLDYYTINSLIFSFNVPSFTISANGTNIYGGIYFENLPDYYLEASTGGGVSIEELAPYFQDIQDKLDIVTGDPSQAQQNQVDNLNDNLENSIDNIQDQLDIIESPTMPDDSELPTLPFDENDMSSAFAPIAIAFGDISLLNMFNIIVPTGCVGFLIYTILRRF